MMKRIYLIIMGVVLQLTLVAQPRFVVDQETRSVGEVMFQLPTEVVFVVKNKGNQPLLIKNIDPSCNCTMVKYPEAAIEAGGKAEIVMRYDCETLGTFYKEMAVYTNVREEPFYLVIRGRVVTELHNPEGTFPIDLGTVRMEGNNIEFDDVRHGDHPVKELKIVNTDHLAYRPQIMHLPPYLEVTCEPEVIPGGKVGTLKFMLNSEKLDAYGLNQTSVYLSRFTGDRIGEENEILVSAVLIPSVAGLTREQIENGPSMSLSATELSLENMGKKDKRTATIVITNRGKKELSIKQLQIFSRAVGASLSNRTIKPGKSAKLKISVTVSRMKKAKARPRILLISDDPETPTQTITITP